MLKVGIVGYGNLGRGVECAVSNSADMELYGVFTRRDPASLKTLTGCKVYSLDDILSHKDSCDVLIICGGSATDLPEQTPYLAKHFTVVDSFDTHAKIPEHFKNTDASARAGKKCAVISAGWDPGMFSINRLLGSAILPDGKDYTFWGKGVSQGHSDAVRRIDGVLDARQYTVPIEAALDAVRAGKAPELSAREKHLRECYVVASKGADKARIEKEIKEMRNYFADYDTTVHFVSAEELKENHSRLSHGGFVIRTGKTGPNSENSHVIEYSLKLDSNPEFTASVLVCYARAAARLTREGVFGAKTVLDIAPAYLSPLSDAELRATLL